MNKELRSRWFAHALVISCLAASCAPAPEAGPAETAEPAEAARDLGAQARAGIEEGNRRFMEALSGGDAAGVAAQYTTDARLLPPNAEAVEGPEAIREFWAGVIGSGVTGVDLETVEVDASDGWAWEVGRLEIRGADDQVVERGSYAVRWELQDGTWKLDRDIWNSRLTPGGEPSPQ